MTRFVLAMTATLMLMTATTACSHHVDSHPVPLTPQQIAERALPAIVLIHAGDRLGTGFLIWKDGRIATNLHVILGAPSAEVLLADGRRTSDVEVLGVDEAHDLAVIRIPIHNLPVLELGDSDAVKPGQRVVAIGHPMGLGDTVSDGLISAVRDLGPDAKVLQISAPIAQGSSGGPLIDDTGKVVGVAFMVSERGQNLNFAVPVNYLKPLLLFDRSMSFAEFARRTAASAPREDEQQPAVQRHVPRHPLTLLDDCPLAEMQVAYKAIGDAITLGAPLYNSGNHAACFKIYEGTALDLEAKLKGCVQVKKALADGRSSAGAAADDTARAWAMRDAFDGLIIIMEQKAQQGPP